MSYSTRSFSKKQEVLIADTLFGGRGRTPNSGAGFTKADVQTGRFIIEAKTHISPVDKHSILLKDLEKLWKLSEGALKVPMYIFDFGKQVLNEEWVLLSVNHAQQFTPGALNLIEVKLTLEPNAKSLLIRKSRTNTFYSVEINSKQYVIAPLNQWKGV